MARDPLTSIDQRQGGQFDEPYLVCEQMPSGKLAQSPKPLIVSPGSI